MQNTDLHLSVKPSPFDHPDLTVGVAVSLEGVSDIATDVSVNGAYYGTVQRREDGTFRPNVDGGGPVFDNERDLATAVQVLAEDYVRMYFGLPRD